MLNIVIPMAGAGSRFAQAGFTLPKPLIEVHGVPMIELVIGNIKPVSEHRFIFIVQNDHLHKYQLADKLSKWAGKCEIISIDGLTEGAACTVLKAGNLINNYDPLMIANSDQFVEISIDDYLEAMSDHDGLVMTMHADNPKWSFAEIDENGYITRIVEKQVISKFATVGIYNFARGSDFVEATNKMIADNERVNGEFYVAPVYNRLIAIGGHIASYNIGEIGNGMYGLGTPADLQIFLEHPDSKKWVEEFTCE